MIKHDKANEVIKKYFDLLENRYQNFLQLMKGSKFVIDCVHFLRKINLNCGRPYIDFPDWIKRKTQQ